MGGQRHAPAVLPPEKTRYPLYRRLGGHQGRSGRVRKISPPTGIRSPDRPACSESLYRLRYPRQQIKYTKFKILWLLIMNHWKAIYVPLKDFFSFFSWSPCKHNERCYISFQQNSFRAQGVYMKWIFSQCFEMFVPQTSTPLVVILFYDGGDF
jgi:hypothetical protein